MVTGMVRSSIYDSQGLSRKSLNSAIPHSSCTGRFVNICFDIGGVLLKPSLDVSHGTALHPALFKRMMRSHAWYQYQEGKLSWTQARRELAQSEDHIPEADIQLFIDRARASLAPVAEIVEFIKTLRSSSSLKLYCMTNAAKEDYEHILTAFPDLFQAFDAIFYSGAIGIRKPSLGAYQHFLHDTKCHPSQTLFVDDTVQNVVAADVLGFTTILVKDSTEVVNLLVSYLRTEEERLAAAWDFLRRNKGQPSVTFDGVRRHVLYDHFLVAELLHDPSFLPLHAAPETGRFNFYPPEERQNFLTIWTQQPWHYRSCIHLNRWTWLSSTLYSTRC